MRHAEKLTSRMNLRMLAFGRGFGGICMYIIACDLILLIGCIFGGDDPRVFFPLLAALDAAIVMFSARYSFRAKCSWQNVCVMNELLKRKKWIRKIEGKTMTFRNSGWEYVDSDWFVRVNESSACVLYASEMDFAKIGVHTEHVVYDDFGKMQMYAPRKKFDRYTFLLKDGTKVMVQIDCPETLLRWVGQHGGRTALHQE